MNARDALQEMERLQRIYNSDMPLDQRADELAFGLALICEDVKTRRISGLSQLEPDFKKAAAIYEGLAREYRALVTREYVDQVGLVWPTIR